MTEYMTEEWKTIPDYPNYSVSNFGRVRNNLTGRILRPGKHGAPNRPKKYYHVVLSLEGKQKHFQVHQLVAQAFIANPENKTTVNHIDGNGFNNVASNLEWCSYSENLIHSYHVLNNRMGFESGPKKVIRLEDGCVFASVNEAARLNNIKTPSNISRCLQDVRSTAGGYRWKYYEE